MKTARIELEKQDMTTPDEIKYVFRDPCYFNRAELRAVGSVSVETACKAFMLDCDQDSGKEPEPESEPAPEKRTLSVNTIMWILSLVLGIAYVVYQYVYPLLVNN